MVRALLKRLLPPVLALAFLAGCVRNDNPVLEGTPPESSPSASATPSSSP
ncbi:MAG TPA: hypothetical protein VFV09_12070 [Actinomycetota bacterium]|nr:hypothetical protein [Actinomycetota bacterium]